MAYLTSAEATARGVTATDAQLATASTTVDAFLKRPEGLLWSPDGDGAPCYMTGLIPLMTLQIVGTLQAGVNASVTVTGWVTQDLVGEVLIADRATSAQTEALVVSAVQGQVVTFASVLRAHTGPLEAGMVLTEERSLPEMRPVTQLSRPPVRLLSGLGRYGYGRRSQQARGLPDYSLLPTIQTFGGVPLWQPFDIADASASATGDVWIPAGIYASYFSEVRLRYLAGFQVAPEPVKQATLNVATVFANFPQMSGNMKSVQAGGTKMERFADQALDLETRNILAPYAARLWA